MLKDFFMVTISPVLMVKEDHISRLWIFQCFLLRFQNISKTLMVVLKFQWTWSCSWMLAITSIEFAEFSVNHLEMLYYLVWVVQVVNH
jgi:hypothetical protein